MWRNSYGRLFRAVPAPSDEPGEDHALSGAGPDALTNEPTDVARPTTGDPRQLVFKFDPDMRGLINTSLSDLPVGSDGWAIHQGWVSVTPLRASFAEPAGGGTNGSADDRLWTQKL